jgi:hypothetical protein
MTMFFLHPVVLVRESRFNSANGVFEPHERQDKAGIAYCRGGIGARDDGGAVGTRDDDGDAGGLRAGAAGGCGGGSVIFKNISATADSSLAMSRAIES